MYGWIDGCMAEDVWMYDDGCMYEDVCMVGMIEACMAERMVVWTDGCMAGCGMVYVCMDEDEWTDVLVDVCMIVDVYIDGCMYG